MKILGLCLGLLISGAFFAIQVIQMEEINRNAIYYYFKYPICYAWNSNDPVFVKFEKISKYFEAQSITQLLFRYGDFENSKI